MDSKKYEYWFLSNPEVTYGKKEKLYEHFKSAYNIFYATEAELKASNEFNKDSLYTFIKMRDKVNLDRLYEEFTQTPFKFVTKEDEAFPERLINIANSPYGLFYLGELKDLKKTVSIVGARMCSAYGKKMAISLSKALAENGYTVISGMAKGIDSYAHRGCLDGGGKTIAVLGNGVDVVYPKENRLLYEEIAKNGAIVSEYPLGSVALPRNFPLRNRIISALSQKVIVVEAKLKSGSLITADYALEQGKDIYVVPGRVGDSLSAGCNKLATQGAGIIVDVESFINDLNDFSSEEAYEVTPKENPKFTIDKEQLMVYSFFDLYPKSITEVQLESKMDFIYLLGQVMTLVSKGLLKEVFKGYFIICG